MSRKWKFYFWFYVVGTILTYFAFYGFTKVDSITFGDLLTLIISILGGIGLYSYVYRKKILPSKFWIVLFWLLVLDIVFGVLLSTTPLGNIIQLPDFLKTSLPESKYFVSELFGFVITLPTYYAIYKLGQK